MLRFGSIYNKVCGMSSRYPFVLRLTLVMLMCLCVTPGFAAWVADGGTYYDLGAGALWYMTTTIVQILGYYVTTMYILSSLFAIYNTVVIITKMQLGEQGFSKSVLMLVGSILFVLGATILLPALFGYSERGGDDIFTELRLW